MPATAALASVKWEEAAASTTLYFYMYIAVLFVPEGLATKSVTSGTFILVRVRPASVVMI